MAKKTVEQAIIDPATLTLVGYKTVEVDEEDAPQAALVKHIAGASFDSSAETLQGLAGRTVDSESAQGQRLKAAAEEDEATQKEKDDADATRQKDADERATTQGLEPTVGQVKAEQRAKPRK